MTNAISSLTAKALQAGANAFSAVQSVAHTIGCAAASLLSAGWANARARDQQSTDPAEFQYVGKGTSDIPTTQSWGSGYDDGKDGPQIGISVVSPAIVPRVPTSVPAHVPTKCPQKSTS